MNIQSMCANIPFLRILNHAQRLKVLPSSSKNFLSSNKVIQNFCEPISRIICTQSNVHACNYETEENEKEQSFYIQESFLKENFNISDSRYFKLVTLPSECNNLEEVLWTDEFKKILSRSPFSYDVNVVENPQIFFPKTSINPHVYEDSLYTDSNSRVDKPSFNDFDVVFSTNSDVGDDTQGRATEEQLLHVINRLTYSLINFFEQPHDYSIYHKNIIFLNNIKGVTIKGLSAYAQSMYIMKLYGLLHFAKVKVEILKVTHHIEDGTIRVRWRVNGLSRHRLVLQLWKQKVMNVANVTPENTEWLDGFSVFSVGSDGLIYKHICDKMIPDQEKSLVKNDLKSKVLGLLGLTPRTPAAGTINTLIPCYRNSALFSCKKLT